MTDLVKRTYRVKKSHDAKIKRLSKKSSESQIVRDAIDLLPESNERTAQKN